MCRNYIMKVLLLSRSFTKCSTLNFNKLCYLIGLTLEEDQDRASNWWLVDPFIPQVCMHCFLHVMAGYL